MIRDERSFEERYLSGLELYGDDLTGVELSAWYAAEAESYTDLWVDHAAADGGYEFEQLTRVHGLRHLGGRRFSRALGLGSSYGQEFLALADRIDELVIVESSIRARATQIGSLAPTYVEPSATSSLPFQGGRFDLVTCFGVLHHIANVSATLAELHRVMAPGGVALVREPIVSMGDWRLTRPGLTPRERGIPLALLEEFSRNAGFTILRRNLCMFGLTSLAARKRSWRVYSRHWVVRVDALLASTFRWNYTYHATSNWRRLRPTAAFLILRKPPDPSIAENP